MGSSKRSTSLRRGYTAVEVMLSVAVLAVGASGVMAMQKASIQGNNDARMLDQANALARQWVERLRRDGMMWTQPDEGTGNSQTSSPNWSTNTNVIATLGNNIGTWQFPATSLVTTDGYSPAADILGRDVLQNAGAYPNAVFCTQMRGDWLVQDQLMRVTVRVYWYRQLYTAPAGTFCVQDDSTGGPSAPSAQQIYHFVYATTAVRRNPGQ